MQPRRIVQVCLAVCLAATLACQAQSAAPDERGLWSLWVACTNNASDHAVVVSACKEFIAKSTQDPFVVVAQGLEAWRLLKQGNTNAAVGLLEPMLAVPGNATPLQIAGADIARSWLTRLDRERVRVALGKLYVRDIEFPVSLDALKTLRTMRPPPFTDRWGTPWVYRQQSSIKGMNTQQYVLESPRLGSRTDLAKALAMPYAGGITLEPVKPSPIGNDTYQFASPKQKAVVLQVGADMDGITVAYLGEKLIVMSDGNHWRVVLKP